MDSVEKIVLPGLIATGVAGSDDFPRYLREACDAYRSDRLGEYFDKLNSGFRYQEVKPKFNSPGYGRLVG